MPAGRASPPAMSSASILSLITLTCNADVGEGRSQRRCEQAQGEKLRWNACRPYRLPLLCHAYPSHLSGASLAVSQPRSIKVKDAARQTSGGQWCGPGPTGARVALAALSAHLGIPRR
eukprot:7382941-Prymnesium_polylepis.1